MNQLTKPLDQSDQALLIYDNPFPNLLQNHDIPRSVAETYKLVSFNLSLNPDAAAPCFPLPMIACEPDNTFTTSQRCIIRLIAYTHAFNKIASSGLDIDMPNYLYPYMALIAHMGVIAVNRTINNYQPYFNERFELIEHIKLLTRAVKMRGNASIYGQAQYMEYFARSERYLRVMGCTV